MAVAAGSTHTFGVRFDGTVITAGNNDDGTGGHGARPRDGPGQQRLPRSSPRSWQHDPHVVKTNGEVRLPIVG
ncbi:RCC1 domain-containing protein [Arthrobacter pigmenti]|uniref:RCC1-like domain-containing protein n=1 Tax=Arthrobacter pigmenti TaxID=271432 RepID=UPI00315865F2